MERIYQVIIEKNYEVHGIKRRALQHIRIDHLYHDKHKENVNFFCTMET